jgi:hypothetical protein
MVMTVDIPEKLVAKAAALGMPLDEFVLRTLHDAEDGPLTVNQEDHAEFYRKPLPSGFAYLGPKTRTREQAAASIREIASRSTLGGLKIKDLIEEGRRV